MNLVKIIGNIWFMVSSFMTEILKNIFGLKRRCQSSTRLDGKVVVITGANTGIGKETAKQLSLRGAKIIIGCRDVKKGENAIDDIKTKNPNADLILFKLDLSSLTSVRQFAKQVSETVSTIDILINNAGVMMCPEMQTEDGFEMQFGTNHLGHFLLTHALMPLLKKSPRARIINVSSQAHLMGKIHFENINLRNKAYDPSKAYGQSKLANILFTRELAKRLGPKSTINTYSLHPGIIASDLGRHLNPMMNFLLRKLTIDVDLGSQTTLYCALEESLDNESGHYYDDCKRVDRMLRKTTNDEIARKLWEMSEDMVKLEDHLRLK